MILTVLMASHNRWGKTVACLRSVFEVRDVTGEQVQVFLVDSNSSNGTPRAVSEAFPQVNLFQASKDFFWEKAMRLSWEQSQEVERDYTLGLNDDVVLLPGAISSLIRTARNHSNEGIVTGSTVDPSNIHLGYGVHFRGPCCRRLNVNPVVPRAFAQQVDFANGNIMLVPWQLEKKLGGFPNNFTHGMADLYFGIRAHNKGGVNLDCARSSRPVVGQRPTRKLARQRTRTPSTLGRVYYPEGPSHLSLVPFLVRTWRIGGTAVLPEAPPRHRFYHSGTPAKAAARDSRLTERDGGPR
jgi:GT2 family glycosyltransferase